MVFAISGIPKFANEESYLIFVKTFFAVGVLINHVISIMNGWMDGWMRKKEPQ